MSKRKVKELHLTVGECISQVCMFLGYGSFLIISAYVFKRFAKPVLSIFRFSGC